MPLKIVRNDITKMNTEAIVNTANEQVTVGAGCDSAVYNAAGFEELLNYRKEKIGPAEEGCVFLTPGFNLKAQYIIHAVSPLYKGGEEKEEEKLRSCYRKVLQLAKENEIKSIAFPLISTGSFGYPKEEGMRIAVDEINAFLLNDYMEIYLVVFDDKATELGKKIFPDLESYIDRKYVDLTRNFEHGMGWNQSYNAQMARSQASNRPAANASESKRSGKGRKSGIPSFSSSIFKKKPEKKTKQDTWVLQEDTKFLKEESLICDALSSQSFDEQHESSLEERMSHLSDTYSEYLMYLIKDKNMENADVWKRAIVDKKVFSKIKNNVNYHPNKLTALCLCVGAKLNLDETKDLLARAGYALSPCDKTDIIFSYFIENEIYDMIELDIQLEEHGLPCIIA